MSRTALAGVSLAAVGLTALGLVSLSQVTDVEAEPAAAPFPTATTPAGPTLLPPRIPITPEPSPTPVPTITLPTLTPEAPRPTPRSAPRTSEKPSPPPPPAPTPSPSPTPAPVPEPPPSDPVPAPGVLALVNRDRAAVGCAPVALDSTLQAFAETHSTLQATDDEMKHSDGPYAENVGYGYATAEAVHAAWMNSEGHRSNILGCSHTLIGVAWVDGADGTRYWTEVFA